MQWVTLTSVWYFLLLWTPRQPFSLKEWTKSNYLFLNEFHQITWNLQNQLWNSPQTCVNGPSAICKSLVRWKTRFCQTAVKFFYAFRIWMYVYQINNSTNEWQFVWKGIYCTKTAAILDIGAIKCLSSSLLDNNWFFCVRKIPGSKLKRRQNQPI